MNYTVCIQGNYLEDDGAYIVVACNHCNNGRGYEAHICSRQNPQCLDCQIGRLVWHEAGYVPGTRICDVCGSMWSHMDYGASAQMAKKEFNLGPEVVATRERFFK